jgi:hypothetical protein
VTAYAFAQNPNHVAQALALFSGQFRSDLSTPNLRNLLRASVNRTQDVENVLASVMASQLLVNNPTGQALNQIGDLIGAPRGTFTDSQYLLFVRVAIRARRNGARSEDAIQVAALALTSGAATYIDYPPAAYEVQSFHVEQDYIDPLGQALAFARPLGVRGVYKWSDQILTHYFRPADSVNPGVTPGSGLGDSISGAGNALLAGSTQL